ncbi:MAG: N-acetylmuramoyl-L-alanine amidase [Bacteroidetes bacterium]|nr:N-acetylmuramoyl-L-alanine amidase [Bacteroidota bacterium]MBS1973884.1 N-acetylmuramoyl-L-alanine amidase [Bacteroidota bacterium]
MRSTALGFIFFVLCFSSFSQDSILLAKSTGELPFIKYGIGEDRLGGAKMGYIDSNIILKVVDSFKTDYKVQLSKYHSGYIAKENTILLYKALRKPVTNNPDLSGSIKVFGDSAFDYVTVHLKQHLPYHSFQLINPSCIAVDIFGATSNTNWITQLKSSKEIKNTWYEQIEDDVFRIYIQLKHEQHWGYGIAYDTAGNTLVIKVKPQPTVLDIRKLKIAIDAGHGGDNSGASGISSGIIEKNYTLVIAKYLQAELKKAGVKNIFMTRTKDTSLSMAERIMMLREYNPDLLVSIHLNSASSDTIQGVSTYYRYIGFRSLSEALLNRMLSLGLKEFGNVGSFNFALSGPTEYPNALVEVAFLSNKEDERKIISPKFERAVAQKIYLGIADWLKQIK